MGIFSKEAAERPEYDVTVTTTEHIAGREVQEYLGIVSGRAFVGEMFIKLEATNKPEKPNEPAKETIRASYQLAEHYLKAEAATVGANAVIGVTVQHVRSGGGLLIAMTGTAVVVA